MRAMVKISPFTRALYLWFLNLIQVATPFFLHHGPLGRGLLPPLRPQLVQSHLLKCLWNDFLIFYSMGYGSTSILNTSTTGVLVECVCILFSIENQSY